MIVAAPGDERPETQRSHDGQPAGVRCLERGQHFIEPEKRFEDKEIDAGIFEDANLLGDEVLGLAQRSGSLALDELRA